MVVIRKSPFKVNQIEDNPHAFGNRPGEVISILESLLNNRNILISGPRGIGKSSLACQIQNIYKGDKTLIKRCGADVKLDNYLTCFYACDVSTSLSSFALDLIFRIENCCKWIKTFRIGNKKKFEAALDLKFIKAKLETDIITSKPASVATQLINGLNNIYKSLTRFTKYNGINILIDELDQLSEEINFGHFVKIIHEYMKQDKLININFIFAGQKGVFTRLYKQDASIERLITNVPISKLDKDECNYILNYASTKIADPPFTIEPEAEELILKLASGFPYVIHLLGDSAFSEMEDLHYMKKEDVIEGIKKVLTSDKTEKYYSIFNSLTTNERKIITVIARYESSELPMSIPFDSILYEGKNYLEDKEEIMKTLFSLEVDGHIIINEEKQLCQFNDELFRIFLALMYLEERDKIHEEDKVEFFRISDPKIQKIINQIEMATYNETWEVEQES